MFLFLFSQGGCFDPLPQNFPTQQPTATPVPMDPKLPTYTSQFTAATQAQFPPDVATVGPQGLGFGAPRGSFPGGTTGMGLRPGLTRPQGMGLQLRLPPNQLRLQLQQRLHGPQQVMALFTRPLSCCYFWCLHNTVSESTMFSSAPCSEIYVDLIPEFKVEGSVIQRYTLRAASTHCVDL